MRIKERFKALLQGLCSGIYEKDTEIGMSLLAAIAGESVLLLGPPGVAKSLIGRRIKRAFTDAREFEYLMSRFSTPDELFGPVSIARLKSDDVYERLVDGYLPTADIVFLDEIWKAGPAILNTLLTLMNERLFRNGNGEVAVPLKLLIGASNELPAAGEGLEALWDRFLIRMVIGPVKAEASFRQLVAFDGEPEVAPLPSITETELLSWKASIAKVKVTEEAFDALAFIRKGLASLRLSDKVTRSVYVSDRRWKHIVHLLRASAFLHGREEIRVADFPILRHCLWNETEEIEAIGKLVLGSLFTNWVRAYEALKGRVDEALRLKMAGQAVRAAQAEGYHVDDNKVLVDTFYFQIEGFSRGDTRIFFTDYKRLPAFSTRVVPLKGVVYTHPKFPDRDVLAVTDGAAAMQNNQVPSMEVKVCRDADHIYINGVRYDMRLVERGTLAQRVSALTVPAPNTEGMEAGVEQLSTDLNVLQFALKDNMFISAAELELVQAQSKGLMRRIALLRSDIEALIYG
ncbi:MAG: AAA family ATPase [Parabacteroides sp.]